MMDRNRFHLSLLLAIVILLLAACPQDDTGNRQQVEYNGDNRPLTEDEDEPPVVPGDIPDLAESIIITPGGGQIPTCFNQPLPENENLPTISIIDDAFQLAVFRQRTICVYGVPFEESFGVYLYTPEGGIYSRAEYIITEPAEALSNEMPGMVALTDELVILPLRLEQLFPAEQSENDWGRPMASQVDGIAIISVPVWWSANAPVGEWEIVADFGPNEAIISLENDELEYITTQPHSDTNPFVNEHCLAYQSGETMMIEGKGFPKSHEMLLGLYHRPDMDNTSVLIDSLTVWVDDFGRFSTPVDIQDEYPAGSYLVLTSEKSRAGSIQGDLEPCFGVLR